MTTTVTVNVPNGVNYKAIVEHVDRNDNGETQMTIAQIIEPGEVANFYVTDSRDVNVREVALNYSKS